MPSSAILLPSSSPPMVDHGEVTTTVVNTITETTLFTGTIPAGNASVDCAYRITAFGDYFNNSVGTKTVIFKLYQQAVAVLASSASTAILSNANRGPWRLDWIIQVPSLTTQRGNALIDLALAQNANPYTVNFKTQQSGVAGFVYWNGTYINGAHDMNNAMTVSMSVIMSTADPLYDYQCHGFTIEKLSP